MASYSYLRDEDEEDQDLQKRIAALQGMGMDVSSEYARQTRPAPADMTFATPQLPIQDLTVSPPAKRSIAEMMRDYIQAGPAVTPSQIAPEPTIKGALKEFLLTRIPGYSELRRRRMVSEEENRQLQNEMAMQQWKANIGFMQPMVNRDYEMEQKQREIDYRSNILIRAGVPRDKASIYAMGMTPPTARPEPEPSMYQVHFKDNSPPLPAYSRVENGVPKLYTFAGKEIPPEAIKELYKQSTEPRQQTDEEKKYQIDIEDALTLQRHSRGEPVDPATLERAQARVAYEKMMRPPTPLQLIQTQEGYGWLDPRTPGRALQPAVGPAGEQVKPPEKLSAQDRNMVNHAYLIKNTENELLKLLDDPQAIRDVGVVAGRVAEDLKAPAGLLSPKARQLFATLASYYSLQGKLHGWRAIRTKEEFQKAVGGMAQTRESLIAGIRGTSTLADTWLKLGEAHGYAPMAREIAGPFENVSDEELRRKAEAGDVAARDEWIRRYEERKKR